MDVENTPKEKVLADLREAFLDVIAGRTIPADEALERLRAKRKKQEYLPPEDKSSGYTKNVKDG